MGRRVQPAGAVDRGADRRDEGPGEDEENACAAIAAAKITRLGAIAIAPADTPNAIDATTAIPNSRPGRATTVALSAPAMPNRDVPAIMSPTSIASSPMPAPMRSVNAQIPAVPISRQTAGEYERRAHRLEQRHRLRHHASGFAVPAAARSSQRRRAPQRPGSEKARMIWSGDGLTMICRADCVPAGSEMRHGFRCIAVAGRFRPRLGRHRGGGGRAASRSRHQRVRLFDLGA